MNVVKGFDRISIVLGVLFGLFMVVVGLNLWDNIVNPYKQVGLTREYQYFSSNKFGVSLNDDLSSYYQIYNEIYHIAFDSSSHYSEMSQEKAQNHIIEAARSMYPKPQWDSYPEESRLLLENENTLLRYMSHNFHPDSTKNVEKISEVIAKYQFNNENVFIEKYETKFYYIEYAIIGLVSGVVGFFAFVIVFRLLVRFIRFVFLYIKSGFAE